MKKNKFNMKVSNIEKSAVLLDEKLQTQRKIMFRQNPEIISEVYDYIFGVSENNPLEEITSNYHNRLHALHQRDDLVKEEKLEYLGKSKKGIKQIKKIVEIISKESTS